MAFARIILSKSTTHNKHPPKIYLGNLLTFLLVTSVIFFLYLATDVVKVKRLQYNLTLLGCHIPPSSCMKYSVNDKKLILRNKGFQEFYVNNDSSMAV